MNSFSSSASSNTSVNSCELQHEEKDTLLVKLEKLPEELICEGLFKLQHQTNSEDYLCLKQEHVISRNETYVQQIKKTFVERSVGVAPDTSNPCNLSRELKRRIMSGCSKSMEVVSERDKKGSPRSKDEDDKDLKMEQKCRKTQKLL